MKKQPRRIGYGLSDRKAGVALIALAVAATLVVGYLGWRNDRTNPPSDSTQMQLLPNGGSRSAHQRQYYNVEKRKTELFPFDPNTADSTALLRLGLRPWQVRNIYKYRANGGVYSHPNDFARLYGLTAGQFRRLRPYIRISPDFRPASETIGKTVRKERDSAFQSKERPYSNKISAAERIILNTADTTELVRVPGIGRYYARQIVYYGQRLGGYVSVAQLDEIEDFPVESKQYFTIEGQTQRRINVNKLTLMQMCRHPYMGYSRAKAITDYRRLHGRLQSLDQLRACRFFTAEAIRRLEPYVEF